MGKGRFELRRGYSIKLVVNIDVNNNLFITYTGGLLVNQTRVMVCLVNHFADFVQYDSQKMGDGGFIFV